MDLPIWDISHQWNHTHVTLEVWLLSHIIMAKVCPIMWMGHVVFIHSYVLWTLGCSHLLAVVSPVAMNTWAYVCLICWFCPWLPHLMMVPIQMLTPETQESVFIL